MFILGIIVFLITHLNAHFSPYINITRTLKTSQVWWIRMYECAHLSYCLLYAMMFSVIHSNFVKGYPVITCYFAYSLEMSFASSMCLHI